MVTRQNITHGVVFESENLCDLEGRKERNEDGEVSTPHVLGVEIETSLEIFSPGDHSAPAGGSEQSADLVDAELVPREMGQEGSNLADQGNNIRVFRDEAKDVARNDRTSVAQELGEA